MRIHLGHHFYGAGNLGDDFMLAGFLTAMRTLAPGSTFTGSVPFPREPLQARFPEVAWLPYETAARADAIAACDAWLGLGGSPFQHDQSRWFVDHLADEARACARHRTPMYYLGVGVQSAAELDDAAVRELCRQAAAIWTRDQASTERLRQLALPARIESAADLAHVLFQHTPPPAAAAGRIALVANFDYRSWPGQDACLRALTRLRAREHVWLAQESRELPGAERALHASLPAAERARWTLHVPDEPGTPLAHALARWPGSEWLVTARYHAALAAAWAGSRTVIIATNEKLRGAAAELGLPSITPDASEDEVWQALERAAAASPPRHFAARALAACADFARSAVAHAR